MTRFFEGGTHPGSAFDRIKEDLPQTFLLINPLKSSKVQGNILARKYFSRRFCLNLLGVIVLLSGLASAVMIYQKAAIRSEEILGYDESGGIIRPEDSKQYLRGLELYGGKANVLADNLRRKFLGLWQGKSLAVIVGITAVITAWGCFHAAQQSPDGSGLEDRKPGDG